MSETGRPGRYHRSFAGLVASLLVTVVGVVAFVGLRSLVSDSEPFEPTAVDYLDVVRQAQDSDVALVYPPALPEGWIATDVDFRPGEVPAFGLSMLTGEGEYVGLRAEDTALDDLLVEHVDETTRETEPLVVEDGVASRWEGFADDGGDSAYAAEVGQRQVLVYGSAPPADLATLIGLLSEEPAPAS